MHTRAALIGLMMMATATNLLAADPMPPNPALPTLWLVGDSTVHQTGKTMALFSWGDLIHVDFDQTKLNVVNRARGGRSSRTFITEGLWDDTVKWMKRGDFMLIQMGHNDHSPVVDADRCRGSLPGTGEETQVVDNNVRHIRETVHTYGHYMRQMVAEAQSKGVTVIVLSPVPRAPKTDNAGPSTEATEYREWSAEVAQQTGAMFVNLNELIWAKYRTMKVADIRSTYFTPQDGTHSSGAGARLNKWCVIQGLRGLKNNPLADYITASTEDPTTRPAPASNPAE